MSGVVGARVIDAPTDDESYLWAILSDPSGIDQAEFMVTDETSDDGCFRAWPFQHPWWRDTSPKQIDQGSRSSGKSMSIRYRTLAFPFIHPGQEMVITAPEGNHLDAITDNVEIIFSNNRLPSEMLVQNRGGIKHRPYHMSFMNGARVMGRIPQRDGKGIKGCPRYDMPVITSTGVKMSQDVVKGDMVINDQGKWVPVTNVIHDVNDCYRVTGAGSFPLEVSCDHRFLGAINQADSKHKRDFTGLQYEDVECLIDHQFYWATPTNFPHLDPEYPEFTTASKTYDVETEDFWWLVGLYVADGYVRGNKGKAPAVVNWVSHPRNKGRKKLIRALEHLGCTYRITKRAHSSADQVGWTSMPVAKWLADNIGRTTKTKTFPPFVLSLPESFRVAFMDGYLSGDGHWNADKGRWQVSSASKELMIMMQLLAQSMGLQVSCHSITPKVTEIMGVPLKESPQESWRIHISDTGHAHEIDGYLVNKVKSVEPIGKQPVVNIVVEDGHSYLSGSIMSHNIHPVWLEIDEACFPGETLVLTTEGHKPISEVMVGDEVLTHKGRWRKVLNVFDKGERELVEVRGQGHPGLTVTPNHRFWGKEVLSWKDERNKWGPKGLSEATWIPAGQLEGCFWSSPAGVAAVEFDSVIPRASTGPNSRPYNVLDHDDFFWVMGLYLAEGSTSSSRGTGGREDKVTWSIHKKEVEHVVARLESAGWKPFVQPVQNSANAMNVVVSSVKLAEWVNQLGSGCHNKRIPAWAYGLSEKHRQLILDGLVYGDGYLDKDERYAPGRWKLSTTSKALAFDARLLAQSLAYVVSVHGVEGGKKGIIRGKEFTSGPSYQVVGALSGQGHVSDGLRFTRVKEVNEAGMDRVYDIEVEEDHSFVAEGVVVHNSDYPEAGWNEIIETINRGTPDSQWRAHGVTRGIRDKFYEYTQPESGWKVHHLPAMYRPTWTDEERVEKIQLYGHRDSPDFRRNIYGVHGDASSPMFVLHRLMACGLGSTPVTLCNDGVLSDTTLDNIGIGDRVANFMGSGEVVDVRTSEHDSIYEIRVEGESLFFSEHHPFFTQRGWVFARDLSVGDQLFREEDLRELWGIAAAGESEVLFQRLLETSNGSSRSSMPSVSGPLQQGAEDVLFAALCGHLSTVEQSSTAGEVSELQWGHPGRQGLLPVLQPELLARMDNSEADRGNLPPVSTGVLSSERAKVLLSSLLWQVSRDCQGDRERSSSRCLAPVPRVESVQVHVSGSEDFLRISDGADTVTLYDLTVSGHPSFFVGSSRVLVHNCCDDDQSSDYNTQEYWLQNIDEAAIREVDGDVLSLLDFPVMHKSSYKTFWIGMDVGYCVDTETEIFTKRGWLRHDEVEIGDETLVVNEQTHLSEWQPIESLYEETLDVEMWEFSGQSFSAKTTPHHRWLVKTEAGDWRWKTTDTLNTKDMVPLAVPRGDFPTTKKFSDAEVEMVAWVYTEGSVGASDRIEVSQSRSVHPEYVERIRGCLTELFGEPGDMREGHLWREWLRFGDMSYFNLSARASRELLPLMPNKVPSVQDFLSLLTEDQLKLFLEVSEMADGWTIDGHVKFEQHDEERTKAYEAACVLYGKPISTSSTPGGRSRWHTAILDSDFCRPVKALGFPRKTDQAMTLTKSRGENVIWCPTVKHRNWLARRNGSIYFTGNTQDPSAICVFAEWRATPKAQSKLKLISRLLLKRVGHREQIAVIMWLIDQYRPAAFAMDRTGLGLPLYQDIQEYTRENAELRFIIDRIRGYNFSEKIPVEFDDMIKIDEDDPKGYEAALIKKNVLEFSSDSLRSLVDEERIQLPWDRDLIGEFRGQTWSYDKNTLDMYGRRKTFNKGSYHSLDACRMAVLGWKQATMEEFLREQQADSFVPADTIILDW